jgi:hypothetical protein
MVTATAKKMVIIVVSIALAIKKCENLSESE